mmetsp:Transcript_87993/g.247265  ORF Transcript_87993/g.247265 Transcript_87993/m.247265 type:complete len:81 (-) Transcript_87993:623-865(-)
MEVFAKGSTPGLITLLPLPSKPIPTGANKFGVELEFHVGRDDESSLDRPPRRNEPADVAFEGCLPESNPFRVQMGMSLIL